MTNTASTHLEVLRFTNGLDFLVRLIHDTGSVISEHFHNALELIYVFEGEGLVVAEGRATIAKADELLLINPNVSHRTSGLYGNINLLLQFPAPLLSQLVEHADALELRVPPVAEMTPEQLQGWQRLQQAAHKLRRTIESPTPLHNLHISLFAQEILDALYTHFSLPHKTDHFKERNLEKLRPVLEYIDEHYTQPLTVREVAAVAGLQAEYFCRFFKKHTGTTFLEHLNSLRLTHIYSDLVNTDKPIMQIIEAHGFTNYKLFTRMFRAQFKATPREIRTREKNREIHSTSNVLYISTPTGKD